jgi:hypothetical protein
MITRFRSKLTYSNIVASLALFAALGGVAVAAGLPRNSVGTKQLKRNAVTAAKLKRGAVTSSKIAPGAVIAGKLSANAVGTGNLGNGVVNSAKLAANSVIASTIKNGVITTNKLDNDAVTTAKLANGAVTTGQLANGSVTAGKLAGDVAPLLGTLNSGQTLRGVFNIGGSAAGAEAISFRDAVGFQFPLLNTPNPNVLQPATTSPACTGLGGGATPAAAAGQLCVYITGATPETELTVDTGSNNRLGFGLLAKFKKAEDDNFVRGQWAVTAP